MGLDDIRMGDPAELADGIASSNMWLKLHRPGLARIEDYEADAAVAALGKGGDWKARLDSTWESANSEVYPTPVGGGVGSVGDPDGS